MWRRPTSLILLALGGCGLPADFDGDGFGIDVDCDDGDVQIYPGAVEHCDGLDDDCDGRIDGGAVEAKRWFQDMDRDGSGDPSTLVRACEAPPGFVAASGDCADACPLSRPGAVESCNGLDDDCDGQVDVGAVDLRVFYADADGDGFGGARSAIEACSQPVATADNDLDCDDLRPEAHPNAVEICGNGLDDNCDALALIDEDCIGGLVHANLAASATYWADPRHHAGADLAMGDHDGDGISDLFIGGPEAVDPLLGEGEVWGGAWLLFGRPGVPATGNVAHVYDAWFYGSGDGDRTGAQAAFIGDLNGDGYEELSAEAPDADGGLLYVRYGQPVRPIGAGSMSAWLRITGSDIASRLGDGITGVGDIDGDGYDDAAFSEPTYGADAGAVFVLRGHPSPLTGTRSYSEFPRIEAVDADTALCAGKCITAADFDGDGLSDLAIGATGADGVGHTWIQFGDVVPVSGTLLVSDLAEIVEPQAARWGEALDSPGDLNGDGYPELAVGDPGRLYVGGTGAVTIFAGSGFGWTGLNPASGFWLHIDGVDGRAVGSAIVGPGDLDRDGVDDLAIGSPDSDGVPGADLAGAVGLFYGLGPGVMSFGDAGARVLGDQPDSSFGKSMAVGDLDGDGAPDLAIGADRAGDDSGWIYLFMDGF